MNVAVIGASGNMGRRYCAILRYLGIGVVEIDEHSPSGMLGERYDKVIIATPTRLHFDFCEAMAMVGNPFLVEKPLDTDPKSIRYLRELCIKQGVDGRMVCNWAFAGRLRFDPGCHQVQYSNFHTGNDGLGWDCIQLIYLAKGFPELSTGSPFLQCHIDDNRIHEGMIAMSYKKMVEAWLQDPAQLWSLEDAKKATEKTILYMEAHK